MLTQRPAAAMGDLRTATDLMSAAWRAGSPLVAESPAAIEWWYALTFPDPLGDHLRLWFDGSQTVAWSWHEPPELETHVWSGDPDRDTAIYRDIIGAVIDEADGREVGAFAAEDDPASSRSLGSARAGDACRSGSATRAMARSSRQPCRTATASGASLARTNSQPVSTSTAQRSRHRGSP